MMNNNCNTHNNSNKITILTVKLVIAMTVIRLEINRKSSRGCMERCFDACLDEGALAPQNVFGTAVLGSFCYQEMWLKFASYKVHRAPTCNTAHGPCAFMSALDCAASFEQSLTVVPA